MRCNVLTKPHGPCVIFICMCTLLDGVEVAQYGSNSSLPVLLRAKGCVRLIVRELRGVKHYKRTPLPAEV